MVGRRDVQHRQARYLRGMIERQPMSDAAVAVVAGDAVHM